MSIRITDQDGKVCLDEQLIAVEHSMSVSRVEFERNLHDKKNDPAFLGDIKPLLVTGVNYDAQAAMTLVREALITRLPGEAWRGPASVRETAKRSKPRRRRGKNE